MGGEIVFSFFKKAVTTVIDWFLYSVLSENQKKKLANLFSDEQKERIKKITKYGKKHSQKVKVKQIKDHLYTLGFTDLALGQLKNMLQQNKDPFLKRLVAWELTLWYTNKYTQEGAKEALRYIKIAEQDEKDSNQLRRIAIIKAECLGRISKIEDAQIVIKKELHKGKHPDLYLALANLEDTVEMRLKWVNKVYAHFNLNPITFKTLTSPTYDDLKMAKQAEMVHKNEKVSVILPAYNAGNGIQIAIESILSQTWENIELLVVDDCSTDNTFEIAKSYEQKDNRVKVFSTPQNSGPYVARNIALQAATGDFVTVNDADDWSHEKKLETQAMHLIQHPSIIANTSAHSRLTEDLLLYRRGTPGKYIFPNMSSIMFRRKPVMESLGFWDSVRFAADGEFKRRLLKVFGKEKYADLDSGPLSLPRQAVSSLTSSSAFGYNGFFMGVRKEYVESLEYYHHKTETFHYPYPMETRPFPVPEPMWPKREEKEDGKRRFDIVIATDYRDVQNETLMNVLNKIQSLDGEQKIGFIQLYQYDVTLPLGVASFVREIIDGEHVQMVVYGEKVVAKKLIILDHCILQNTQKYIPKLEAHHIDVIIQSEKQVSLDELKRLKGQIKDAFSGKVTYYSVHEGLQEKLLERIGTQEKNFISNKVWVFDDDK